MRVHGIYCGCLALKCPKIPDRSSLQCKHDQTQTQYAEPLLEAAMCFKNFAGIAILAFQTNHWYIHPSISESCSRFTGDI